MTHCAHCMIYSNGWSSPRKWKRDSSKQVENTTNTAIYQRVRYLTYKQGSKYTFIYMLVYTCGYANMLN